MEPTSSQPFDSAPPWLAMAGGGSRAGARGDDARTPPAEARPMGGATVPSDEAETDLSIVERVVRGDRDAFASLVEKYQHYVYRLSLRLSSGDRDRAGDLSQESFLRAYRGLSTFGRGALFQTWLHRITVNTSISIHRKERALKRGRAVSLDAPLPGGDEDRKQGVAAAGLGPAEQVLDRESRRRIEDALAALDQELRVLVTLVNLEGMSYEQAALELQIPIGTVRSRLHRAREIMSERLKKHRRPA